MNIEIPYWGVYLSDGTKEWRQGGARVKDDAIRMGEEIKESHPHLTYAVRPEPEPEPYQPIENAT